MQATATLISTILMLSSSELKGKEAEVVSAERVRPRVLLTDTDRRPYAARLASNLAAAGCEVCCLATRNHPVLKTKAVERMFSYSALRPVDALLVAIEDCAPDIVVPCCDRGVQHLHELHGRLCQEGKSEGVARLIERSLGRSSGFALVSARYNLLQIAQQEGLRVPDTGRITSAEDLQGWEMGHVAPWVLKSDGTWGGRGVRIVHTMEEAKRSFAEISQPFRFKRAVKRLCVNRDPFWISPWWNGVRPSVIVQSHIAGRPANCGVVAWEGQILAGICVEVVSADGETGPASVVRVVDSPDMMGCAERLGRRLNLSGFFGLDFIIENGTGKTYLIEMNPRCTPVCHLRLGQGRDLVGAFAARLLDRPSVAAPPVTDNDLIAYFPQAWRGDRRLLDSAFHDIPKNEPELVKDLLSSWPERSYLYRAVAQVHGWAAAAAAVLGRKTAI